MVLVTCSQVCLCIQQNPHHTPLMVIVFFFSKQAHKRWPWPGHMWGWVGVWGWAGRAATNTTSYHLREAFLFLIKWPPIQSVYNNNNKNQLSFLVVTKLLLSLIFFLHAAITLAVSQSVCLFMQLVHTFIYLLHKQDSKKASNMYECGSFVVMQSAFCKQILFPIHH